MTTDITELAQILKAAANTTADAIDRLKEFPGDELIDLSQHEGEQVDIDITTINEWYELSSPANILALVEALEKAQQHIARQEQILLNQDESLSIRRGELEASQQERENWRTSFDNERFRADKLKAHIDDIEPIRAAAEKLVRCKGRYHSEQNYRALAALFGVNTPDLPPLDSESRPLKLPPELYTIGELIRTQDNRITDQPMFVVFQKREIIGSDEHSPSRICWVWDGEEVSELRAKRLEALYQDGRDTRGYDRYAMQEVDEFVTACFTEHGCKDFLRQNGHNLRQPYIYACGSFRNNEYQLVRNWLAGIKWEAE